MSILQTKGESRETEHRNTRKS